MGAFGEFTLRATDTAAWVRAGLQSLNRDSRLLVEDGSHDCSTLVLNADLFKAYVMDSAQEARDQRRGAGSFQPARRGARRENLPRRRSGPELDRLQGRNAILPERCSQPDRRRGRPRRDGLLRPAGGKDAVTARGARTVTIQTLFATSSMRGMTSGLFATAGIESSGDAQRGVSAIGRKFDSDSVTFLAQKTTESMHPRLRQPKKGQSPSSSVYATRVLSLQVWAIRWPQNSAPPESNPRC